MEAIRALAQSQFDLEYREFFDKAAPKISFAMVRVIISAAVKTRDISVVKGKPSK